MTTNTYVVCTGSIVTAMVLVRNCGIPLMRELGKDIKHAHAKYLWPMSPFRFCARGQTFDYDLWTPTTFVMGGVLSVSCEPWLW